MIVIEDAVASNNHSKQRKNRSRSRNTESGTESNSLPRRSSRRTNTQN